MKISVIVSVYNVEKYLKQCLDSIVNQTYSNLEIIIVNDGSTDSSPGICDEFAKRDSRITVFHQPNGGVSVARNTGIEKATGDYLTFVDSDDWLEAEMYEQMTAKILEIPRLDMVMCDSALISKNCEIKSTNFIKAGFYPKKLIVSKLYPVLLVTEDFGKIPIISACSVLVRKSILINNKIFFHPDLKYSEDYLFMADLVIHTTSFFYLKGQFLYNYRQYEQSRSKKFQPDWWNSLLNLNKKLKELLKNSEDYDFTRHLKMQLIHSALFVADAMAKNAEMGHKEKVKELRKLFNDPDLQKSFDGIKIETPSLGLKAVLFIIKHKMALTYLVYIQLVSQIKSDR